MIFENEYIYIEQESSTVPWVKIFSKTAYKEFNQCDSQTRAQLLFALDVVEKTMLEYYKPTKINIASFGNYVHWHVMARFENDSHFPESMWGAKQRDTVPQLPSFEAFAKILVEKLSLAKQS
jgi:diadenosine tetraphosphate (Ap4A) HIT family hydrolase